MDFEIPEHFLDSFAFVLSENLEQIERLEEAYAMVTKQMSDVKVSNITSSSLIKDIIKINNNVKKPRAATSDDIKCVYPSFGPDEKKNGYIVEFKHLVTIGKFNGVDAIVGPGTQVFISNENMKLVHRVATVCRLTSDEAMRFLFPLLSEYNGQELKINLKGKTGLEIVMLRKKLIELGWPKEMPLIF
jgi:uncharacterized protein (UPF0335 family)